MQGFFSWEQDGANEMPFYMPTAKAHVLSPQGLMNQNEGHREEILSMTRPSMPSGPRMPTQTPAAGGGLGGSGKKPAKQKEEEEEEYTTRPSETWQPDYNSHDTTNALDPLNPNNYEWDAESGEFVSKLKNPLDPANWGWDSATNAPTYIGSSVWDESNYQGTLYDPSNPFDLTEQEWVKMTGLLNSGSLLQEGMGLAENADLIGGLSDMGGVGDEIASQLSESGGLMGGDWMGNLGKLSSAVGIAKGIYGLTQGSGGQGGVDLATGIAGNFIPMIGIMKGIFDAAMGVGQYVQAQGRQYDYYHPALNEYATDAAGNTLMNLNFYDDISDAGSQGLRPDNNWGNYYDPYSGVGGDNSWKSSNLVGVDNATGTMYWMNGNVSDYLGEQNYYDYLGGNGVDTSSYLADYVGMSGGGGSPLLEAQDRGLMSETEWNQRLQDTFMSEIAKNGIDFSNPAFSKVNMGNFNGQLVTDVGGTGENANRLVKIAELAGVLNNAGSGMDLSQYADYLRPDNASYGHSPSASWLEQQQMMNDPMFYGM